MWSMKKQGMKESREMYLKSIYQLNIIHSGKVRNTDIANYLHVTRPSVTRAVSLLHEENLIAIENNGIIHLTNAGEAEAKQIIDRYTTIIRFLKDNLELDETVICSDACQIEHVISDELYEAMQRELSKI